MTRQLLDSSTSKRVSNDSSDGIAVIINNLDSLVRDMKKLKENVHEKAEPRGTDEQASLRINTKKSKNGRMDEEASGEHIIEYKKPKCLIKNFRD
ncbi:hypothetical protein Tco_0182438, partial [Tanacetum coccineum]